jgi:hypothetical protein
MISVHTMLMAAYSAKIAAADNKLLLSSPMPASGGMMAKANKPKAHQMGSLCTNFFSRAKVLGLYTPSSCNTVRRVKG